MYRFLTLSFFIFASIFLNAQELSIPKIYSNLSSNTKGELILHINGQEVTAEHPKIKYQLNDFLNAWSGNSKGLVFKSTNKNLKGTMYFGLIPYGDSKFPQPVFFKRTRQLVNGKTDIKIAELFKGKYDMIGWEKSGKGVLGYRILSTKGKIIYDGIIGFKQTKNGFEPDITIIEGPMINMLTYDGAVISFKTNEALICEIIIDGKNFKDQKETKNHEIKISGLEPNKKHKYKVVYGNNTQTYSFQTAPKPGSRTAFTFAYASDSRGGNGGGERNIYGHNGYVVKKIMALATLNNSRFIQFTGDLIDGYALEKEDLNLQYANFKTTVSPFAHYTPLIAGMGNHETLNFTFKAKNIWASIEKFPFNTNSAENIFANNFVNPLNGPVSEDNNKYDPDKTKQDFPSYKETVFYYTYDNIAMIVLNSNYLYAPSTKFVPQTSGNIHGYIMDNQLKWFEQTLKKLEKNELIDHIFVTIHTPAFPNGGHTTSDMYYSGNNEKRPFIAGKPVDKGIIERRDEFLNAMINKSKKTVALLVGDEHNYNKLKLSANTNIYPKEYKGKKLNIKRTFWQINNGAAGAPYYAQEQTPWTKDVSGFTTQNAVCLFYIDGKSVKMKVLNPDTLEEVDEVVLR